MHRKWWLLVYPLVLLLYGIYSYSQVAPNLVLSSNPVFWQFQQSMWQLGYHQRPLSTYIFVGLVLASFAAYALVLKQIQKGRLTNKLFILQYALCIIALLPSYPALSNDIFNYLMNAKMMHVYNASPYEHAAWDFPQDPWQTFMVNVSATTPYGYVWTGIGYLAYMLAFGDLQFGIITFRLIAFVSVLSIGWSIWMISPKKAKLYRAGLFMFNPLVMMEAINNMHNDITMMAFLLLGLALYFRYYRFNKYIGYGTLFIGWLLSIYTKLVTIILPAVLASYFVVRRKIPWFNAADYGAMIFTLALFNDHSRRFFSWYLLWAFCLAPLARSKFVRNLLLLFSFTGLLSYVFFLYTGEYTSKIGNIRIGWLYSLPIIFVATSLIAQVREKFFHQKV